VNGSEGKVSQKVKEDVINKKIGGEGRSYYLWKWSESFKRDCCPGSGVNRMKFGGRGSVSNERNRKGDGGGSVPLQHFYLWSRSGAAGGDRTQKIGIETIRTRREGFEQKWSFVKTEETGQDSTDGSEIKNQNERSKMLVESNQLKPVCTGKEAGRGCAAIGWFLQRGQGRGQTPQRRRD